MLNQISSSQGIRRTQTQRKTISLTKWWDEKSYKLTETLSKISLFDAKICFSGS